MFIDTHCHLNYSPLYKQVNSVIKRALDAGVEQLICVGTDIPSSGKAIHLAEQYSNVFAAVGIHPHDTEAAKSGWQKELIEFTKHDKVVAIGEIGLDYYRNYAPEEIQIAFFSEQIEIAKDLQLPVVIHNRQADKDIKDILTKCNYYNCVLHCYSSNADYAKEMLQLGLYISFTGSVTYGSKKMAKAVEVVPFNRLMLETDSPFLTPSSKRGETNEPANIPLIAQKIAELKGCTVDNVASRTTKTAFRFFDLQQ